MANYADCRLVEKGDRRVIVAVTSGAPDRLEGAYYTLHSAGGALLGSGHSKGWDGKGAGSYLSAMKNGIASAKRLINNDAQWARHNK